MIVILHSSFSYPDLNNHTFVTSCCGPLFCRKQFIAECRIRGQNHLMNSIISATHQAVSRISTAVWLSFVLCAGGTGGFAADNFSIDWFTIDGGGGALSGGTFTLEGTTGQLDAGPVTLAGGTQSIKGGFWSLDFSTAGTVAPTLRLQQTSPTELSLSWFPDTPGYLLQQGLTLLPDSWTTLPSPPENPTSLTLSGDRMFFRLIKP